MSAAKAVGGLVVLAAVLGGGLYAGDRYAEGRAEEYAKTVVSDNFAGAQGPTVDIKGFPFLTQLLSGTLDEVTASIGAATLQGVAMTDVDLDARSVLVRPPDGQPPMAGRASVTATIPVASIQSVLRDRTRLTAQVAVTGATLQASGDVLGLPLVLNLVPRVDAGRLVADVQGLTLGGRDISAATLPSSLRDRLDGIEVPVEGLPAGLTLTRAEVLPTGVRITAEGSNVVVPQGAATR